MGIPGAYVCHQSSKRLRFKITSRKGNAEYFEKLKAALSRFRSFNRLEVNVLTGSILFEDEHVNLESIANFAKDRELFDLMDRHHSAPPITTQLVSQLGNLNSNIRRLTTGEIDLAGILLLLLLTSGAFGLLKGNFRLPPWYTAFWYAFGIYKLASAATTLESKGK
jgi:hypothetical protein